MIHLRSNRPSRRPATPVETLVERAAGQASSLVLANGAAISTWSAGHGLSLTQSDPALRPTYMTNGGNGHPAVAFTEEQLFDASALGSIAQPLVVVQVYSTVDDDWTPHIVILVLDGVNSRQHVDTLDLVGGPNLTDPFPFTTVGGGLAFRLYHYGVFTGRPSTAQITTIGIALAAAWGGTWTL